MIVGVPTEAIAGENRVAQTPETTKQLVDMGLTVHVQKGAGSAAGYPDTDYQDAGAKIVPTLDVSKVDVLTHVRPLGTATVNKLTAGTITVGLDSPASEGPVVKALAKKKVETTYQNH